MISKVIFSNRGVQNFINNSTYEALLIQEIIWRSNTDGTCEPYIVGKLISTKQTAEVNPEYSGPLINPFLNIEPFLNLKLCN